MALNLPQFYCYGLLFFHQYAIVFVFLYRYISTYRDVPKNSKMCAHISNIHSHAICQEKMFFCIQYYTFILLVMRRWGSLLVMDQVIKSRVLGFCYFVDFLKGNSWKLIEKSSTSILSPQCFLTERKPKKVSVCVLKDIITTHHGTLEKKEIKVADFEVSFFVLCIGSMF